MNDCFQKGRHFVEKQSEYRTLKLGIQIMAMIRNLDYRKSIFLTFLVLSCLIFRSLLYLTNSKLFIAIQARIAQLVAYRLGTGEVPGSNPGKGENFSVKISNWIVRI